MLRSRRRLVGPLGVLAGLAIAFPLGVLAAVSFADVPPGHPFYFDIQAVAEKGVTTGCGGGNYCPDQNVTRGQMAAFMNRLGALAPDKTPVVNADKLDGLDANQLTRVAYAVDDDGDAFLGSTGNQGTILSTTITAPKPGYLIIRASSDVFNYAGSDSPLCYVTVNGSTLAHSVRQIALSAGNPEEDCSSDGVWTTVAGGASTIDFVAVNVTSASTVFDEATLVVQYMPFGAAGSTPAIPTRGEEAPPKSEPQPNSK